MIRIYRCFPRKNTLILTGLYFLFAMHAQAACTVTQDDGGTYTDTSVSNCGSYYPELHFCRTAARNNTNGCARLDMFFAIEWNKPDLINNTHRGVWGLQMKANSATSTAGMDIPATMTGAPENSISGVDGSVKAGWKTVEYDIFLARDDAGAGISAGTPVIGHYTDVAAYTNYNGSYSAAIPETGKARTRSAFLMGGVLNDLGSNTLLRDRDGVVSQNKIISLGEFIDYINTHHKDMVIVLDPKFAKTYTQTRKKTNGSTGRVCIGFCGGYYEQTAREESLVLLKKSVDILAAKNAEHRVIFKLPQALFPYPTSILTKLGANFYQVLYAPQPDPSGRKPEADVLAYITRWTNHYGWGDAGKSVAFWDTAILSNTNWMGKSIYISGDKYADLTDYLKQKTSKRSAIWAQDPAGKAGRHGNYFSRFDNYAGSANDFRGDLFNNLYLRYAMNAVITTDRPDVFLGVKYYLDSVLP